MDEGCSSWQGGGRPTYEDGATQTSNGQFEFDASVLSLIARQAEKVPCNLAMLSDGGLREGHRKYTERCAMEGRPDPVPQRADTPMRAYYDESIAFERGFAIFILVDGRRVVATHLAAIDAHISPPKPPGAYVGTITHFVQEVPHKELFPRGPPKRALILKAQDAEMTQAPSPEFDMRQSIEKDTRKRKHE